MGVSTGLEFWKVSVSMHVSAGLCCFEFTYKFWLLVQTHFVNIVIDVGGGGGEDIWS